MMGRLSTVKLISETPGAHGVFDTITETAATRYCSIKSVSQTEMYTALSHGLTPSVVVELSHFMDYGNQKIVEYNGERYNVIRTYIRDDNAIELTLERSAENAR